MFLDPEHVLAEYPRPQLVRDSYLNLNGWWDYAFTPASAPSPTRVRRANPGPVQPRGAAVPGRPAAAARRAAHLPPHARLPDGFVPEGGRVLLHFGAVDQTCTVRIDGVEVGANEGGYLPFTCDVTDALRAGEHELVVDVRDLSDRHQHASGKQRLHRGGIWYTAQSGIWQTVWVEAVPAVYVDR